LSLENSDVDVENVLCKLDVMSLDEKKPGVAKTPRARTRKLTTRKRDLGREGSSP